jgi:hypothetical protein
MRTTIFIAILFFVVSCAPQKEIAFVPETIPPVPAPVQSAPQEITVPQAKYKSFFLCDEKKDFFNTSGIEVLPSSIGTEHSHVGSSRSVFQSSYIKNSRAAS